MCPMWQELFRKFPFSREQNFLFKNAVLGSYNELQKNSLIVFRVFISNSFFLNLGRLVPRIWYFFFEFLENESSKFFFQFLFHLTFFIKKTHWIFSRSEIGQAQKFSIRLSSWKKENWKNKYLFWSNISLIISKLSKQFQLITVTVFFSNQNLLL